jgi:hypothetical protein
MNALFWYFRGETVVRARILHGLRRGSMRKFVGGLCWIIVASLGSGDAFAERQGAITALTLSPATAEVGATVTATATGSAGPCGAVHIDWDDGTAITYATETLPVKQTHVYKATGAFDLRAQGMGNCLGEARARIVITSPPPPPAPPPAAPRLTGIALSDSRVPPRTAVAITLEGTGACSVTLDFGDGNSQEIRGALPTAVRHAYPLAGRYSIAATPAPPCSERRVATLDVGSPPSQQISGLDVALPADGSASVRALTVLGSGHCSYTVDFGDGNSDTREGTLPAVVRHNYPAEGRYTAIVTARPPCSGERRATFTIGRGLQSGEPQGSITRVDVRSAVARVGDQLTLTIAGSGTCTFGVDLDDGQSRTLTGRLPYRLTHRYATPGDYEIVVWAHEPCTGGGDAVLRIRRR